MRPTLVLETLLACAVLAPFGAARQSEPTAVVGVRLSDELDAPRKTLVLENGRIRAVLGASDEVPADLRRVEADGLLAVPAFLDAFTLTACAPPEERSDRAVTPPLAVDVQVDMPCADRAGVRPAFRTVDALALDAHDHRAAGFGAVHTAPGGRLLGGWSALVTTGDTPLRERVVAPVVFQCASFAAAGEGIPSTLMARLAVLRQFFLDARRHELLLARADQGGWDRRPPYEPALEAVFPLLAGDAPLVCHAEDAGDLERWLALTAEADVPIVLAGGREAWRLADWLATSDVPVLLTLEWDAEAPDPDAAGAADEADPWRYEEPLGIRRERRREWLEQRDGALRLHEAGVRFAFGSGGGTPGALLERVRQLVAAGLPRDVALAGLTSGAAELLGVGDRLGALAPGHDASFALWSAHPLTPEARLVRVFVDGVEHEIEAQGDASGAEPAAGIEAAGTWSIQFEGEEARPATMTLAMDEQGVVTGSFATTSPADDSEIAIELAGRLAGAALTLHGVRVGPSFRIEMELSGTIADDTLSGDAVWTYSAGEQRAAFRATRAPR